MQMLVLALVQVLAQALVLAIVLVLGFFYFFSCGAAAGEIDVEEIDVAAALELVQSKQASFDEVARSLEERETSYMEAVSAQGNGDASFFAAKLSKEAYESVVENQFNVLRDTDLDPEKTNQHLAKLMPFINKIGVYESLISDMSKGVAKKLGARGPFDIVVMQELEKSLATHIASIDEGRSMPVTETDG